MVLAGASPLNDPDNRDPDIPRNDMDSLILQLRAARAFADRHDWFQIATSPAQARRIIGRGDLAVVLSIEASNLMPESRGMWQHQMEELYDLGVRSLSLVHETDSRFSGSARHHGLIFRVANVLQDIEKDITSVAQTGYPSIDSLVSAVDEFAFGGENPQGLTAEGRALLRWAAKRGMMIEVDHLSRATRQDLYEFAQLPSDTHTEKIPGGGSFTIDVGGLDHYPLFFSHTRFDDLIPSELWLEDRAPLDKHFYAVTHAMAGWGKHGVGEYMASAGDVEAVKASGGIIGLRTGPNAIKDTGYSQVENTCLTSSRSFAQLVDYGANKFEVAMALGSDLGGTVPQIGPRFGEKACSRIKGEKRDVRTAADVVSDEIGTRPGRSAPKQGLPTKDGVSGLRRDASGPRQPKSDSASLSEFDREGIKDVSMLPALIDDLEELGASTASLRNSAELFLRTWERAFEENRKPLSDAEYDEMMAVTGLHLREFAPVAPESERPRGLRGAGKGQP